MLSSFYDWTSRIYWGSQPVALADEMVWLVLGLITAVTIVWAAFRWLNTWALPWAMIVAIYAAVFVAFVPIKHAQRFVECKITEHHTQIGEETVLIELKRCRTRATLDSAWSDWIVQGKFE